jgi:hypothetical protein
MRNRTFFALAALSLSSVDAQIIKRSVPSQLPSEELARRIDGVGLVSDVLVTKDGAPKDHVRITVTIERRNNAPGVYGREVRVRVLTAQGEEIAADSQPKDSQPLPAISNGGSVMNHYELQVPGAGADIAKVEVTFAGATLSFSLAPAQPARRTK